MRVRAVFSSIAFLGYFVVFLAMFFIPVDARAGEPILTVAVASNAFRPVEEIARAFEDARGIRVRIVHGSTGKLYMQITQGAPFDIFLAADQKRPARLVKEGLAAPDAVFTYARGRLVLWTMSEEFDLSLEILGDARVKKIAIANPVTAPYGRAALEAIASMNLLGRVEHKLVYGESVSQAFNYVRTGNAEVAITSASIVYGQGGTHRRIDDALYSAIIQDGVVLNGVDVVLDFKAFLGGARASEILSKYGYIIEGDKR